MRILRRLVIVALIAAVLIWLGHVSGNQSTTWRGQGTTFNQGATLNGCCSAGYG